MQLPIAHYDLRVRYEAMEDVYMVLAGHRHPDDSTVDDKDVTILAEGETHIMDGGTGGRLKSDFGWRIALVVLPTGDGISEEFLYLLLWTDHVANDWGEWFEADTEAFARLTALTLAVYEDAQLEDLGRFHANYNLGGR